MQYTEYEIVREYNSAKYRNKKIGVLAQLNCVPRKEIIAILERNGVQVPQKYKDSDMEEYNYINAIATDKERPKKTTKKIKAIQPEEEQAYNYDPTIKVNNKDKEAAGHKEPIVKDKNTDSVAAEHFCVEEHKQSMKKESHHSEDMINEATYRLVQISLARIENRITRIERKQKKLKRLYKNLANLILG